MVSKLFDKLFITVEVYGELSRNKSLIKSLTKTLKEGNVDILGSPELANLQNRYPNLGIGELSVIASASAENKIAFIEDRKAERIAEQEGLVVFNIPELLMVLKERKSIDRKEVKRIIEELRDKDNYFFKKDVEEALLE